MPDESESRPQASRGNDISEGTKTGPAVASTTNVHLHSTNKIKHPRGAPKTSEIIIFSTIILGFAVLMSWSKFRGFFDAHSGSISAFATISVMVLTAFYVIFARSQWIVMEDQLQAMRDQLTEMKTAGEQTVQQMALMRESNDINRETLHAVHRAYVTFPFDMEGVRIPSEENEQIPKVWRMWIPMVNDGRTPTKDLRYRVNWVFRADGLPDDFTYPDYPDQRQDPRSTELAGSGKQLVPMEFKHADIRNLEGKKTRLFFYGWATYRDVFTGTPLHRTEFCHELTWTKINPDGRIEFAIGAYGPHNSSS